jgi:hypothetical protein
MIISLGRRLPGASSDLPGSHPDRANPPSPFFPCGQSDDVAPLFGLAPSGVCQAKPVTRPAGELLPHRFTLTPAHLSTPWRSVFCGTFPSRDQSGGGRYPPPRPTESGLSSTACPRIHVAIKPSAVAIIQSASPLPALPPSFPPALRLRRVSLKTERRLCHRALLSDAVRGSVSGPPALLRFST